jgi:Mg2+ and Co2+ transporter CorA
MKPSLITQERRIFLDPCKKNRFYEIKINIQTERKKKVEGREEILEIFFLILVKIKHPIEELEDKVKEISQKVKQKRDENMTEKIRNLEGHPRKSKIKVIENRESINIERNEFLIKHKK